MVYDVLRTIDLDNSIINAVYDDLFALFRDINMESDADDLIEEIAEELKTNNPFSCEYKGTFCTSPTDTFITIMYELANAKIIAKYPNATICYYASEYNSRFDLDNETYAMGLKEYQKEEE